MGILVSFLRGIVSLVLFAAAVTTVVIDMEFIGEKLGKYKLLRYGLIAGVVLLLFDAFAGTAKFKSIGFLFNAKPTIVF